MSATGDTALPVPSVLGIVALLGSGALLLGAYYFQYVVKLPPCELCYWQRYPHMVVVAAGLGALAAYRYPSVALVLVMIAITALLATAAVGLYHVGVENRWWQGPQACATNIPSGLSTEQLKRYLFGAKMVRCDEVAWSLWGLSMAAWNSAISALLAFILGAYVAKSVGRS
jgi:disulfide bond formation protein DsbB